ncbi:MAG: formate C-acetyltransferase/glycerol dehydratase family glycyl radical enzyme [Chloroflexi bacterium]|nr:formate C-acetyltransferase/glycerol dehydratase family glycyl radical enzyme [Chloroflexota bacterium]
MNQWDELQANPALAFPPDCWAEVHPDARTTAIRRRLRETPRQIDVERARYTTRSYQCTEGRPMPIRRATMLLDLARQLSLTIYPDELIVGNRSLLPRMGVIAPEGAVDWVDRELEGLPTRPQDCFDIAPEQIRELREEIFPYWRGKTLEDTVATRVPADVAQAVRGRAFGLNQTDHAQGHILPDAPAWLRLGIGGLRGQVAAARARFEEPTPPTPFPGREGGDGLPSPRREGEGGEVIFYDAALIALDAAATLIRRYADLAEQMAAEAPPPRRAELLEITGVCRWLAEHPARNFREALQATWFLFVLLQIESNASSFSPGRLDQYLLPYLAADIAAGRLTLAAAQTWLEHLWLKFNEIVLLRSKASARYFAGFPIGFNIVLGGQLPAGRDATNPLSYMCLRAQAALGLTQPNLSVRIYKDSPQAFLTAAAFVIGKGSGMPQVFNDEVIIPGQLRRGISPEDALNYAVVGCVELSTPGKALGWSDAAMFNMVRVLELTLFGGKDPQTGEQIGLSTPPLDQISSLEALEQAYDAQLVHFVDLMIQGCGVVDRIHAEMLPSPFLSLVIEDCIGRGRDVTAGGAIYNFSGVQGVQIANVADSLAAVEQAVFAEQWIAPDELLTALQANWEGHELLRQRLIHRAPKYGNDDDRVDRFARRWGNRYSELVEQYTTWRGGVYQPGFYTVSAHVPMGANVGATPDGRRRGEPLADGGLSPSAGRDYRGATAVLRSVSKLRLDLASNGTLLNMKFLPAFFSTTGALDKFVLLLRGFCRLKIPHVQFNVVAADTLRHAQAHPEEYRGLVVRVAGYSAYFTELDHDLQNEIISRTAFAEA